MVYEQTTLIRTIYHTSVGRPAALQRFEVQDCVVPHMKGLISDCMEPAGQWHGINLKVCYALPNDPYFTP